MKILKIIAVIFLLGFSLFLAKQTFAAAQSPNWKRLCAGFTGRFIAPAGWTGGSIQVGCSGDNGSLTKPPQNSAQWCKGEIATVAPGGTYTLTSCSCHGDKQGCLIIGKKLKHDPLTGGVPGGISKVEPVTKIDQIPYFKNNNCTLTPKSGQICYANETHHTQNIRISCRPPHATATPTPTSAPHSTPTPTVGICKAPSPVAHVTVTCPTCFGPTPVVVCTGNGNDVADCVAPTPTPIQTSSTSCGNSTNPILEVVGPSSQTAAANANIPQASYTLKLTNCGDSFDNTFNITDDFPSNAVADKGWTMAYDPTPATYTVANGQSKTFNVAIKADQLFDNTSGTSATVSYHAVTETNEFSQAQGNTVSLTLTLN